VAVGFAIANEDGTVLDFHDAGIGDGNSEDVRSEVFEAGFTGTDGLGVDVPIELPDLGRDLIEEAGFFHFISGLGFKDNGESSDGKVEIDS